MFTHLRFNQILEITAQQFQFGKDILKSSALCCRLNTFKEVDRILTSERKLDQVYTTHNLSNGRSSKCAKPDTLDGLTPQNTRITVMTTDKTLVQYHSND